MIDEHQAIAFSKTVPGFYGDDELQQLYRLVAALPSGAVIVELGIEFGRSASIYLQLARQQALEIILVDCWHEGPDRSIPAFARLMLQFRDVPFTLMSMKSFRASLLFPEGRQIDLIHVDADHEPAGIAADCKMWLPFVKSGGVAVFHDYKRPGAPPIVDVFPGVTAAVDRFTGSWEDLGTHDTQAKRRKP